MCSAELQSQDQIERVSDRHSFLEAEPSLQWKHQNKSKLAVDHDLRFGLST